MKVLLAAASVIIAIITATLFCAAGIINNTIFSYAETSSSENSALYARAQSRESYFFSSPNLSSGLFAVPYTYCVEVLSEDGDWYSVKYADDVGNYRAVYGYVQKKDFAIIEGTPSVVYLNKSVTVSFSQESDSNLPMISLSVTVAFYGSYYSGAAGYSYVLYQGSFYYIDGAVEDYPLVVEDETSQPETENATKTTGNGAKIIAGVALGALALFALALIILSGKKHKRRDEDPFAEKRYR